MVGQNELKVTLQNHRKLFVKVNIMDFNYLSLGNIEGIIIGMPNFSNDASSDIRRTCSFKLLPNEYKKDINYKNNYFWINKYIAVYVGIMDNNTNEVVYRKMGTYLVDNPSRVYSPNDNTLNFQGLDLMARLTGLRGGYIEDGSYTIKAGSIVSDVFLATIKELGFKIGHIVKPIGKYFEYDDTIETNASKITEFDLEVPMDINVSAGGTYYELLSQLIDIDSNYQMYFNVDGEFCYDEIPQADKNDFIFADKEIWKQLAIEYNVTTDFESVKNKIEVYGKIHTPTYTSTETTLETITQIRYIDRILLPDVYDIVRYDIINLKLDDVITKEKPYVDNGTLISFSTPSLPYGWDTKIERYNDGVHGELDVRNYVEYKKIRLYSNDVSKQDVNMIAMIQDGEQANPIIEGSHPAYIIKYNGTMDKWRFLGDSTPYAMVEETNSESPFHKDKIGLLDIVLSGGEYENIYTNVQAKERAEYEFYRRCKLSDSIEITSLPIYWLDVNELVEVEIPYLNETNKYIVKAISIDETQKTSLMRVY